MDIPAAVAAEVAAPADDPPPPQGDAAEAPQLWAIRLSEAQQAEARKAWESAGPMHGVTTPQLAATLNAAVDARLQASVATQDLKPQPKDVPPRLGTVWDRAGRAWPVVEMTLGGSQPASWRPLLEHNKVLPFGDLQVDVDHEQLRAPLVKTCCIAGNKCPNKPVRNGTDVRNRRVLIDLGCLWGCRDPQQQDDRMIVSCSTACFIEHHARERCCPVGGQGSDAKSKGGCAHALALWWHLCERVAQLPLRHSHDWEEGLVEQQRQQQQEMEEQRRQQQLLVEQQLLEQQQQQQLQRQQQQAASDLEQPEGHHSRPRRSTQRSSASASAPSPGQLSNHTPTPTITHVLDLPSSSDGLQQEGLQQHVQQLASLLTPFLPQPPPTQPHEAGLHGHAAASDPQQPPLQDQLDAGGPHARHHHKPAANPAQPHGLPSPLDSPEHGPPQLMGPQQPLLGPRQPLPALPHPPAQRSAPPRPTGVRLRVPRSAERGSALSAAPSSCPLSNQAALPTLTYSTQLPSSGYSPGEGPPQPRPAPEHAPGARASAQASAQEVTTIRGLAAFLGKELDALHAQLDVLCSMVQRVANQPEVARPGTHTFTTLSGQLQPGPSHATTMRCTLAPGSEAGPGAVPAAGGTALATGLVSSATPVIVPPPGAAGSQLQGSSSKRERAADVPGSGCGVMGNEGLPEGGGAACSKKSRTEVHPCEGAALPHPVPSSHGGEGTDGHGASASRKRPAEDLAHEADGDDAAAAAALASGIKRRQHEEQGEVDGSKQVEVAQSMASSPQTPGLSATHGKQVLPAPRQPPAGQGLVPDSLATSPLPGLSGSCTEGAAGVAATGAVPASPAATEAICASPAASLATPEAKKETHWEVNAGSESGAEPLSSRATEASQAEAMTWALVQEGQGGEPLDVNNHGGCTTPNPALHPQLGLQLDASLQQPAGGVVTTPVAPDAAAAVTDAAAARPGTGSSGKTLPGTQPSALDNGLEEQQDEEGSKSGNIEHLPSQLRPSAQPPCGMQEGGHGLHRGSEQGPEVQQSCTPSSAAAGAVGTASSALPGTPASKALPHDVPPQPATLPGPAGVQLPPLAAHTAEDQSTCNSYWVASAVAIAIQKAVGGGDSLGDSWVAALHAARSLLPPVHSAAWLECGNKARWYLAARWPEQVVPARPPVPAVVEPTMQAQRRVCAALAAAAAHTVEAAGDTPTRPGTICLYLQMALSPQRPRQKAWEDLLQELLTALPLCFLHDSELDPRIPATSLRHGAA